MCAVRNLKGETAVSVAVLNVRMNCIKEHKKNTEEREPSGRERETLQADRENLKVNDLKTRFSQDKRILFAGLVRMLQAVAIGREL